MPYTCNFAGQAEEDEHGLYATPNDAQQNCMNRGAAATNYMIFSYNPEAALTLAPSDRVEVVHRLIGFRIPRDKTWTFLKICSVNPDSVAQLKTVGRWSNEAWIEILMATPIRASFVELYDNFEEPLGDAFERTLNYFITQYRSYEKAEPDMLEALLERNPHLFEETVGTICQFGTNNILVRWCFDAIRTTPQGVEQLCRYFHNFVDIYDIDSEALLQCFIESNDRTLLQALIDYIAQELVWSIPTGNGGYQRLRYGDNEHLLSHLCKSFSIYPTDRAYIVEFVHPENTLSWERLEDIAGEIPVQLSYLTCKGLVEIQRAADLAGDRSRIDDLRVRVFELLQCDLAPSAINLITPLVPDYIPDVNAIIRYIHAFDVVDALSRVTTDDIIDAISRYLPGNGDVMTFYAAEGLPALSRLPLADRLRIKRVVAETVPHGATYISPWTGRV